jgi:alanine racemase
MSIPEPAGRAWADIDLSALLANARTIAATSGVRLLPMVKADAYGLGAVHIARSLERVDPWGFGVATVEEGAALRAAGIPRPVIVFNPLSPDDVRPHLEHDLRPVIGDADGLAAWRAQAGGRPFHLEVDTGMSRAGWRWTDVAQWAPLLGRGDGWEGTFTHFHSAGEHPESIEVQWQRFSQTLAALPARPRLVHAAASAAALHGSRYAGDFVRPGIFLYGGMAAGRVPVTVARLRARVVALRTVRAGESVSYGATWVAPRDTRVATVGIGYADGIPRSLAGTGEVELSGERVPILGRVTMDFIMVRAPAPCRLGDVATIHGGIVSLDELATRAGTISYELLTRTGSRVERRYG